jgi:SAM-dependent methyltransferase
MLEALLKAASTSTYDFTRTAFPDDPLRRHFPEWAVYYKTKWAIAKVLQPNSILEVGVRFGYSAAAFLDACPAAHYVGIDADRAEFGGIPGAIEWAKKITAGFSAEFLVADSQELKRFPGEVYDLIHVDGQQDGDGTFHDMELACKQARFVLADGFFWTRQNFLALSEFLFQRRDLLEYYCVIPGYAGELLLKINRSRTDKTSRSDGAADSLALQSAYTNAYYLKDCAGFQQYRSSGGKRLEDWRLRSVAALASLKSGGRALDLGCGRGELTYYLAKRGFQVTAVDYSAEAIKLAEQCFVGDTQLRKQVQLLCGDANSVPLQPSYDVVIASDLIEHMSPPELERLYGSISRLLAADGVFVVHTFPNLWYYQYEYPQRRRIATRIGAYLPPQPRSEYEQLMHINEQSPRVLKRQLREHFHNVVLWAGDPATPAGSLARRFAKREIRAAPDLFAVASQARLVREQVLQRLQSLPLDEREASKVHIAILDYPSTVPANEVFELGVNVSNRSTMCLNGFPPNPLRLSYRWLSPSRLPVENSASLRSEFWPPLNPGEAGTYRMQMQAPAKAGKWRLRVTLVQEFVRWFDQGEIAVWSDVEVAVTRCRPLASRPHATVAANRPPDRQT